MMRLEASIRWALIASLAGAASACLAAAAGAGAATGIYLTSRGAESLVDASIGDVAGRAEKAFTEFDIVQDASSSERGGDERELKGKKGDLDVTVAMERQSPNTTKVEVTARKSTVEWDKDFARQVLANIVGADGEATSGR